MHLEGKQEVSNSMFLLVLAKCVRPHQHAVVPFVNVVGPDRLADSFHTFFSLFYG